MPSLGSIPWTPCLAPPLSPYWPSPTHVSVLASLGADESWWCVDLEGQTDGIWLRVEAPL